MYTFKECQKLLVSGELEKCSLYLEKALLTSPPPHTHLLILRAFLFRKRQKYELALNDLENAYKSLRGDENLISFLSNQKEFENAPLNNSSGEMNDKFVMKSSQNSFPSDLEEELTSQIGLTYNEMGCFLFSNDKFSEALTVFSEALKFRNDYGICVNRGDCYKMLDELEKALENYEKAIQLGGKESDISERMAECLYKLGVRLFNKTDYRAALENFTRMINYKKNNADYYIIRAKCQEQLHNFKAAFADVQEALKIVPNNVQAFQMLKQLNKPIKKFNRNIIQLPE